MTVFVMFFIELMASRFDIFGEKDLEAADPALDLIRGKSIKGGKASDEEAPYQDGKSTALQSLSQGTLRCALRDTAF